MVIVSSTLAKAITRARDPRRPVALVFTTKAAGLRGRAITGSEGAVWRGGPERDRSVGATTAATPVSETAPQATTA